MKTLHENYIQFWKKKPESPLDNYTFKIIIFFEEKKELIFFRSLWFKIYKFLVFLNFLNFVLTLCRLRQGFK